MTRQEKISVAILAITVTIAISSQRTARGVGTPAPEAVAYHAATLVYKRLAEFFGKRALEAEASYWKLVN